MIRFLSVGSGSKGNAVLVYDEEALFLVDMGVPKGALLDGLASLGRSLSNIDAAFFTHDHSDHIKGAEFLPKGLPLYAGGTTVAFPHEVLPRGKSVEIKGFRITAVASSHDAKDSRGYVFEKGGEKLSYLTDTGIIPSKTLSFLQDSTIFFIESNHDVDMLKYSGRPLPLINRIRSKKGHLSNVQCAGYLAKAIGPDTREICLAHLSEECNDPHLALEIVRQELLERGIDLEARRIVLKAALQWEKVEG